MGDVIYCCTIMGILIVFGIWYSVIDTFSEYQVFFTGDYGRKVKAVRLWKFSFYLVFVILSFILSFMELKLNITKIMAVGYNLISLMIFFYDSFIKNIKRDEYILILQQNIEKEIKVSDLFQVEGNKAKYNLDGNDETMLFKLVKAEHGMAICREHKDRSVLLIPNENISLDELQFICKQINIYWTYHQELPETVRCFEDKSVYKNIDEYVWELFPRIDFLFLPQTKAKLGKIVKYFLISVLIIFLTLLFLDEFFNCNILSHFTNWLFK